MDRTCESETFWADQAVYQNEKKNGKLLRFLLNQSRYFAPNKLAMLALEPSEKNLRYAIFFDFFLKNRKKKKNKKRTKKAPGI